MTAVSQGNQLVVQGGGSGPGMSPMSARSNGTLGTVGPPADVAGTESLVAWALPVAPDDPKKTHKLRQRLAKTSEPEEESRPDVQDVLDKFIPRRTWTDAAGTVWEQRASPMPASRLDTVVLGEKLDERLVEEKAEPTGINPARRELYRECFTELIRQVTAESVCRGVLLHKIREERELTMQAYESLLASKAGYAFRIALKGEKDSYRVKTRIEELHQKKQELVAEEVRLKEEELRVRAEGEEMLKDEEKKRRDDIANLQRETMLRKAQLEAIVSIPKK